MTQGKHRLNFQPCIWHPTFSTVKGIRVVKIAIETLLASLLFQPLFAFPVIHLLVTTDTEISQGTNFLTQTKGLESRFFLL